MYLRACFVKHWFLNHNIRLGEQSCLPFPTNQNQQIVQVQTQSYSLYFSYCTTYLCILSLNLSLSFVALLMSAAVHPALYLKVYCLALMNLLSRQIQVWSALFPEPRLQRFPWSASQCQPMALLNLLLWQTDIILFYLHCPRNVMATFCYSCALLSMMTIHFLNWITFELQQTSNKHFNYVHLYQPTYLKLMSAILEIFCQSKYSVRCWQWDIFNEQN